MILGFDEYISSVKNEEFDTFDYLNESMSVSMEVRDTVDSMVDFINNVIKNNTTLYKEEYSYDVLKIDGDVHMNIFGCDCSFSDVDFHNFPRGDVDDLKNSFTLENRVGFKNGKSYTEFVLHGSFITLNKKLTNFSKSLLAHELRHAYVFFKIYNGYDRITVNKRLELSKKWKEIYKETISYLKLYNESHITQMFDGEDFYRILFSIYRCDVSEIAAFTQQSYERCRRCKTKNEIEEKVKTTDLYRLLKSFENVQNMLCDKDIQELYESKKKFYNIEKLPSVDKLINLIRKRYLKARKNYGNIIVLLFDGIDKFNGSELIEVR